MDKITIYKVVEIKVDLAAERKRISKPMRQCRQAAALKIKLESNILQEYNA